MTQRMERMLKSLRAKEHRAVRRDVEFPPAETLAELSPAQRVTVRLKQVLEAECPVVRPEERIVFQRTVKQLPPLFTDQEWEPDVKGALHARAVEGLQHLSGL